MKKMILALVAVTAFTMSAQAQTEDTEQARPMPNKEEMIQKQTDMMADSLSLTAEQKEAVLALNTEYADKLRPQMRRPPMGPRPDGNDGEDGQTAPKEEVSDMPQAAGGGEGMQNVSAAREEYNEALKGILTEEQYAKYEQMRTNMRHQGRPGGPRGKGPRGEEGNGPRGPQGPQPGGCPCTPCQTECTAE